MPRPHVVLSAEFVADPAVNPDGPKTHCLVQPDARRVRQRDPGVGVVEPLKGEHGDQGRVQRTSNARATLLLVDTEALPS